MKKFFINLCLVMFLAACTEAVEEMAVCKRSSSIVDMEELPPILDYASDSVELNNLVLEYVERNHAILGQHVMVFQTHNQLYQTIDMLQDLTPDQLREWTIDNNWTNDIIESNILLDSVFYTHMDELGMVFDDSDNNQNNYIELADTAFEIAYELRPDYFIHKNRNNISYWDVLGALDESIFYNDNNILVVEGLVYKSYGSEVVICPIDLFVNVGANANDATSMYLTLLANATSAQLPFVVLNNTSYMKNYWAQTQGGTYYSYISFKVPEIILLHGFWGSIRKAEACVKNFAYSTRKQDHIPYRVRTNLDLTITASYGQDIENFTISNSKKYKERVFKQRKYRTTYWGGTERIISFDLYLETASGIVIDIAE